MSKNIEINEKTANGSYEPLYPKTLDKNVSADKQLCSHFGVPVNSNINDILLKLKTDILSKGVYEIGDIITTYRFENTNSTLVPCDGSIVDPLEENLEYIDKTYSLKGLSGPSVRNEHIVDNIMGNSYFPNAIDQYGYVGGYVNNIPYLLTTDRDNTYPENYRHLYYFQDGQIKHTYEPVNMYIDYRAIKYEMGKYIVAQTNKIYYTTQLDIPMQAVTGLPNEEIYILSYEFSENNMVIVYQYQRSETKSYGYTVFNSNMQKINQHDFINLPEYTEKGINIVHLFNNYWLLWCVVNPYNNPTSGGFRAKILTTDQLISGEFSNILIIPKIEQIKDISGATYHISAGANQLRFAYTLNVGKGIKCICPWHDTYSNSSRYTNDFISEQGYYPMWIFTQDEDLSKRTLTDTGNIFNNFVSVYDRNEIQLRNFYSYYSEKYGAIATDLLYKDNPGKIYFVKDYKTCEEFQVKGEVKKTSYPTLGACDKNIYPDINDISRYAFISARYIAWHRERYGNISLDIYQLKWYPIIPMINDENSVIKHYIKIKNE